MNKVKVLMLDGKRVVRKILSIKRFQGRGAQDFFIIIDNKIYINPLFETTRYKNNNYVIIYYKDYKFLINYKELWMLRSSKVKKVDDIFKLFTITLDEFLEEYYQNCVEFKFIPVVHTLQRGLTYYEMFTNISEEYESVLFINKQEYEYVKYYFDKYDVKSWERPIIKVL